MGERELLGAAGRLQLVVDLAPLRVEDGHGERAEAGGRRDRQALVHVAGERGGRAAQGRRPPRPRPTGADGRRARARPPGRARCAAASDVGLADDARRAPVPVTVRGVDALLQGQAPRDRRDRRPLGVGRRRAGCRRGRPGRGLGGRRRGGAVAGGRRGAAAARRRPAAISPRGCPTVKVAAGLDGDGGEAPGRGGRHLEVDLVGRDLHARSGRRRPRRPRRRATPRRRPR